MQRRPSRGKGAASTIGPTRRRAAGHCIRATRRTGSPTAMRGCSSSVTRTEAVPSVTLTTCARATATSGRVLAFAVQAPLQRTESILFLDVGRNAGVAIGDEFEAYDPRTERRWGTRPEIPVARMQVVKVTEGTASVRVTELEQPRIAVGLPVRRVARMQ